MLIYVKYGMYKQYDRIFWKIMECQKQVQNPTITICLNFVFGSCCNKIKKVKILGAHFLHSIFQNFIQ